MGNIQELDWGNIDWVFEPAPGSNDKMKVGISTIRSGGEQPRHIHIGDEQLMYVLKGYGRQKVGDEELPLAPGKLYHISPGMSHEAVNDGDEEIVKLLISIPAALSDEPAWQGQENEVPAAPREIDKLHFLRQTISEISGQMLHPLKMPLSIYDCDGAAVYQNGEYPAFCRTCCDIVEDPLNCPLYRQKESYPASCNSGPSAFVCQYGLSLYILPIVCGEDYLGAIKAGHVRTMEPAVTEFPGKLPYNVPSSTVAGILQIMERLANIICNYYHFTQMETALENSKKALSDQTRQEELLQSSLQTSQTKAINLQINQHFLFNALNMMMGTAIRENAEQTYQAISSLALMLQYTLRGDSYFVPLREEVNYLKNYTGLQQMRFGRRLELQYDIDGKLLHEEVPFNFLQPIVENCFKHAFTASGDHMAISVSIHGEEDYLTVRITDNGRGMEPEELLALKDITRNGGSSHGTSMVARKLDALYGEKYRYEIRSGSGGTAVTIKIPWRRGNTT